MVAEFVQANIKENNGVFPEKNGFIERIERIQIKL